MLKLSDTLHCRGSHIPTQFFRRISNVTKAVCQLQSCTMNVLQDSKVWLKPSWLKACQGEGRGVLLLGCACSSLSSAPFLVLSLVKAEGVPPGFVAELAGAPSPCGSRLRDSGLRGHGE